MINLGKKSTVRGVAMNPCDHPHGGGEGKKSPLSPAKVLEDEIHLEVLLQIIKNIKYLKKKKFKIIR